MGVTATGDVAKINELQKIWETVVAQVGSDDELAQSAKRRVDEARAKVRSGKLAGTDSIGAEAIRKGRKTN